MNQKIFAMLFVLLLLTAFLHCNDDSDDDDDSAGNDDDAPGVAPGCEGNHGPQLLSIAILVDGVEVEQPVTLNTNNTLAFSFEYEDEECNMILDGYAGSIEFRASDEDIDAYGDEANKLDHAYKLDGIGCASATDGPYLIQVDPNDFAITFDRKGPVNTSLTDGCITSSNHLYLDFTVNPAK